jgi:serine/threonine protein kinase
MPSQANQPLPDGYQLENYRIASVLSCGGFSIVYLAYDENDQPVAIKEYLPSNLALRLEGDALPTIDEDNVAAFRYGMRCFFEEGRALAGLSHPNVVRVLNFFRANETVYMVMRYERGRTLQEHILARRGRLKENFIRHVFAQLLNGLREVHRNKLLHLDIKPANIYIRNDGTPVLIDFGAARDTLSAEAQKLNPMYTPGFAPPEQYRDRSRLGPWSDIYAVGASLFSCIAGAAPQAADQRLERDRYISASRLWEGRYSRALLDTIDWCLELDHMKRPQSVFALQKVLLGEKDPEVHRKASMLSNLRTNVRHNVRSALDKIAAWSTRP